LLSAATQVVYLLYYGTKGKRKIKY